MGSRRSGRGAENPGLIVVIIVTDVGFWHDQERLQQAIANNQELSHCHVSELAKGPLPLGCCPWCDSTALVGLRAGLEVNGMGVSAAFGRFLPLPLSRARLSPELCSRLPQ